MADDSIAVGINSLGASTTGTGNVVIGTNAGSAYTSIGSDNILIGAGSDVPSSGTSNYLNIGGAITGSTASGGFISLTNSPPPGDISAKIATTAFAQGASAFSKLGSGTIDTSSMTDNLIDFGSSTSAGLNLSNNTYTKLILEITKIVAGGPGGGPLLIVIFANQGALNTDDNYGTGSNGPDTDTTGSLLNSPTLNYICNAAGFYAIDGSITLELRGFCAGPTTGNTILPNLTVNGMCYFGSSPYYYGSAFYNIACNNLVGKVFDGLGFGVNPLGSYTFDWTLYGLTN